MTEDTRPEAPAIPGVTRWRKRGVIEAVQLTDDADWEAVAAWCGATLRNREMGDSGEYETVLTIPAAFPEGTREAFEDWWVVRLADADLLMYPPDAFAATYEPAAEPLVMPQDEFEALRYVAERTGAASPSPGSAEYWRKRWTAAMERADGDAAEAVRQHARIGERIGELERRAEAAAAKLAAMRDYRVVVDEDGDAVLIGPCAESIGCLFQRTRDGGDGVTLGELIDAAAEHEGEAGEQAHAYLAKISSDEEAGSACACGQEECRG